MPDQRVWLLLDGHTNGSDEAINDLIEGFLERGIAKIAHTMTLP